MRKLIGVATAHPVSVIALWAVVVVFGLVALAGLPVDLLPTIALPRVIVVTEYGSLPPEEMEQLVTVPLEDALASVSGTRRIESTTKEGISSIELAFDWDADLSVASLEAREQIDRVYPSLPAGSAKPIAATRNVGRGALLQIVAVPQEDRSVAFISETVSSLVAARLRQIPGVGRVQIQGRRRREVQVEVDLPRLRVAGLSLGEVTRTVGESVYELPAGSYEDGSIERVVKITTGVETVEELRRIPLPVPGGALRLSYVAEVRMGEAEATSLFLSDARGALGLAVYPSPGSGALAVSREVRRALGELAAEVGREMELRIVADGAEEIRLALAGLAIAAAIGALAALLVLHRAFRSLLPATLAIAALPISAAGTFLVLHLAGMSINVISLSGIAIGIGMVVDNNVVVLENLRRRGAGTAEEVAEATAEMGTSTLAGTATTLLVFLPIVFVPGVVGLLFRDLAVSVSLLLAFSLPVSLTMTPALVMVAGTASIEKPTAPARFGLLRRCLDTVLRRPALAVGTYFLLVAAAALLFVLLPRELAPERASDRFAVELTLPPGTSYEKVREVARLLDAELGSVPGIAGRFFYAGYEDDAPLERGAPESELRYLRGTLVMEEPTVDPPALGLERGRAGFSELSLSPPVDGLSAALGAGEERFVEIRSPTRSEAEAQAERFAETAVGAGVEEASRRMGHRLILDAEAGALAGVTAEAVLSTLSNAVRGTVAAQLPTETERVDIRVRLREGDAGSIGSLERVAIAGSDGQVELSSLGHFELTRVAETIRRVDRQPAARVRLQSPEPGIVARVPEGGRILGASALEAAAREIGVVFALALLLMYLLLGAQFESFLAPLGILAMIPVGLTGSLALVAAMGMTINVSSVLGVLVLFGTSVNATILLTDAYRRRPGAIAAVTIERAPAVLITSVTTVVALLPLVCLPLPGGELQANTAAPVLGGLIASSFATLVLYPGLYSLGRRHRRPAVPELPP
ncbi:MAG: efflux RND transporter permease subunit [Spirochaetaceae bacterium]